VALRPTVRLRLTLVCGGLFLAAGTVLLVINYGLVRSNLPAVPAFQEIVPVEAEVTIPFPPAEPPDQEIDRALQQEAERFREATLNELLVQSAIALAIMAFVSVGLGWLVAGRVLRPLKSITTTARRLSEENLHERIGLAGPSDELKELADTFDAMLARLEAAFDSQRRFIANASHELRTPLAIEQTMLEVALADPDPSVEKLQAVAEKVHGVSQRNQRLIESLLLLARSAREVEFREPVELAAVVRETVAQRRADSDQRDITVTTVGEPAWVAGDRPLLEHMVANLVENALRHNVDAGWIHISTGTDGPLAHLRVANSGPKVPVAAVAPLFEPFRRFSRDRTGSDRGVGLGLSIVKTIVVTHGGEVSARALEAGGLEVRVTLPRCNPARPGPEGEALEVRRPG
jgi:signal transduction histidine kinase